MSMSYDSFPDISQFYSCENLSDINENHLNDPNDDNDDDDDDELIPFYSGNVVKSDLTSVKDMKNSTVKLKPTGQRNVSKFERKSSKSSSTYFSIYSKQSKTVTRQAELHSVAGDASRSLTECEEVEADDPNQSVIFSEDSSESFYEVAEPERIVLETKCVQVKKKAKNVNRPVNKANKVYDLGSLGPNYSAEKMEMLRKRQNYGRLASEKNKLKVIRNKNYQKFQDSVSLIV